MKMQIWLQDPIKKQVPVFTFSIGNYDYTSSMVKYDYLTMHQGVNYGRKFEQGRNIALTDVFYFRSNNRFVDVDAGMASVLSICARVQRCAY